MLVNLDKQAKKEGVLYEILVGDDCSDTSVIQHYNDIETLESIRVFFNKKRLGRSANRNFLAQNARYDLLLFIDSNAEVNNSNFISQYLSVRDHASVIVGGIAYTETPPSDPTCILRWKYGREVEMKSSRLRNENPDQSFISFNFMIRKEVFNKVQFDDRLTEYGHEDTLFGFQLMKNNIDVFHTDNALIHGGPIDGEAYLLKTRRSLENLKYILHILNGDPDFVQDVKLLRTFRRLRKVKFDQVLKFFFRLSRKRLESYLTSSNPMILFFQLYKLAYYCSL